ncbi:MAG: hypothetical protein AAF411_02480 [Myxococcota bacterium]
MGKRHPIRVAGALRCDQPIYAPCSGQRCLWYEVRVDEVDLASHRRKRLVTRSETASFFIEDGRTEGSPALIESGETLHVAGAETGLSQIGFAQGEVVFGGVRIHLSSTSSGPHARTECTERFVPLGVHAEVEGMVEMRNGVRTVVADRRAKRGIVLRVNSEDGVLRDRTMARRSPRLRRAASAVAFVTFALFFTALGWFVRDLR